jgi:uncharacterized integral membrane protein
VIKDWSRGGTYLGVGAIGVGFLLIFLAWNSASELDYTHGQIPYLISGGVGGLALVIVGSIMLAVQNARRDRAALQRELAKLSATLDKVSRGSWGQSAVEMSVDGLVVAGASSFHLATCRLVQNRDDAERLPRAEAEERGLSPCRICKP